MTSTASYRLRVHVAERDPLRFPSNDEALGESLFGILEERVVGGEAPSPAMLVLREEQVDQFDVLPLLRSGGPHAQRLIAGLAGRDAVEAVVLLGVLVVRQNRPKAQPMRAAVCFVEWPDNRWWNAWQALDPRGELVGDQPYIRRALDGYPKPAGLGGWFSAARRHGLKVKLNPAESQPLVH